MGRRSKREVWLRKYDRLQGLKALLETYEGMKEPDVVYMRHLSKRIRDIRLQMNVLSEPGNPHAWKDSKQQ